MPGLECFKDSKQFLVVCVVVKFQSGKAPAPRQTLQSLTMVTMKYFTKFYDKHNVKYQAIQPPFGTLGTFGDVPKVLL